MLQSEQLDTCLVLAANDQVAAGLLIQRLPMQGQANLDGSGVVRSDEDQIGRNEDYKRIAILASSLKREELLELDAETILRRLFWEEDLRRFEPLAGEQGQVEVGCEFCGEQYRFDPVDAAQVFLQPLKQAPGSAGVH